MSEESQQEVDPIQSTPYTIIDQVKEKHEIYYQHAFKRSLKRYNLALGKKKQAIILDALKVHNPYLPAKLVKDWPTRQLYFIEYMGKTMKLIYDKKWDCIVTFLPVESWT